MSQCPQVVIFREIEEVIALVKKNCNISRIKSQYYEKNLASTTVITYQKKVIKQQLILQEEKV